MAPDAGNYLYRQPLVKRLNFGHIRYRMGEQNRFSQLVKNFDRALGLGPAVLLEGVSVQLFVLKSLDYLLTIFAHHQMGSSYFHHNRPVI